MANVASLGLTVKTSAQVVQVGEELSEEVAGAGAKAKVASVTGLAGWSITEHTGAAGAKVRLYDGKGGSGTGKYLATISLAQGTSSNVVTDDFPRIENGGIYLEVVSGEVEAAIYWSE